MFWYKLCLHVCKKPNVIECPPATRVGAVFCISKHIYPSEQLCDSSFQNSWFWDPLRLMKIIETLNELLFMWVVYIDVYYIKI